MTEDASRPDDTQEADRADESTDDDAAVADSREPATAVSEADGEATEDSDPESSPDGTTAEPGDAADGASSDADGDSATPEADEESADADAPAGEGSDEASEADAGDADAGVEADEPADDAVEGAEESPEDATTAAGVDADDATDPGDGDAEADDADERDAEVADADADDAEADAAAPDETPAAPDAAAELADAGPSLPPDVRKYDRFKKMDGARYERVNEFLRDRTYVTAREWAIARLCADFRTETGVEMTKIGENLPYLIPFMTDTYTPQAVNQARAAFEDKVRKAGATFLYGAMSDFFTADELDDLMYEVTEVAKFLLEVEGVDLAVEEELEAEERISSVMREVRQSSDQLRHEGVCCPECGHEFEAEGHEAGVEETDTPEAE